MTTTETIYKIEIRFPLNLQLFADLNPQVTTDSDLSPEMKTYYDTALLQSAEPRLVHNQFGQKRPIPQGRGKTIEWRSFDDLPKVLTALTEGVTPDGQDLNVTAITATVGQYGGYVTTSDLLVLTAIDPIIAETSRKIGKQAGQTLDTLTRNVLVAGTNVQYGEGSQTSRASLTANDKLTVKAVKMAVRALKNQNIDPMDDGNYVAIIHPDIAFDLTEDEDWKAPHQYVDTEHIYEGEIGKIAGVRFVETTEAAKFIKSAANSTLDVYATLIIGDGAYGVTEVSGGGLQTFVKQLGSAGTADPLNQRATIGWKATHTAKILDEKAMIRVETVSTFNDHVAN